jgi:hypothetical protein
VASRGEHASNYYKRRPDIEVKLGDTATAGIDIVEPGRKHHRRKTPSPDLYTVRTRRRSTIVEDRGRTRFIESNSSSDVEEKEKRKKRDQERGDAFVRHGHSPPRATLVESRYDDDVVEVIEEQSPI